MSCNVTYFANQFADAQGHGMARYALELHKAISDLQAVTLTPAAGWSALPPDRLATLKAETGLRILPSGRRGTAYGWAFLNAPPIEWMMPGPVDVVHAVAMGYPIATRRPLVVTVHDLGPLTHPEYFSNNRPWVMRRALDQAVKKADVIVSISQATADEIVGLHGAAVGDRLRVVHSGVAQRFFEAPDPAALRDVPLPPEGAPFILSAGKFSPRKNIQGVLRALKLVMHDIPHHLVLTGGSGWDMEQITKELEDPALAARVHLAGYVSDDTLRALYRRAAAYVHPSLYEGFGLTVLEAMANGVPVITSNLSSLPEIAGDAALLVDPTDPAAIGQALVTLHTDSALVERLRQDGLQRARTFTWDRTARNMVSIYKEVAR